MKYDLSFLMPGIRPYLWENVYNGLKNSTNKLKTEIIFCGPYGLPESLKNKSDIKYIEDWGNANRAAQICIMHSEGERILLGSDDGVFLPNMLDHLYDTLDELGNREKHHIAIGKYIEGNGDGMSEDFYYYLNNHGMTADGIDNSWLLGCYLLMDREWFLETLGSFNMIFEGSAMACHELSIRIQKFTNAKLKLSKKQIIKCSHMPGLSGDHGPMHYAQTINDEPLYKLLIPNLTRSNLKIDPNNWIETPAIWNRRFLISKKYSYQQINCQCCNNLTYICNYE